MLFYPMQEHFLPDRHKGDQRENIIFEKGLVVESENWLFDTRGNRLDPGTRGTVVGRGSIKDYRVRFKLANGDSLILEVNHEEIKSFADNSSQN